jgi:galactokinase
MRGGSIDRVSASAPGRVNLIGEHTDYNGGFVLPVATPQQTRVELRPDGGREVRAVSAQEGPAPLFEIGEEKPVGGWVDYVAGMTRALASMGHAVGGFELHVDSDLPAGCGLSSSAALEVALGRALRDGFDLDLDDVAIAAAGRRTENEFVGVRSGPMDQLAAGLAGVDEALLIDCRSLARMPVPIPEQWVLVVIDSGERHALSASDYNARREECEQAAALLDVEFLCDLQPRDRRIARLPSPLDRRARHVVEENARVRLAAEAMLNGDIATFGTLLDESHESQRTLFEVSTPRIDQLVQQARDRGALGARLTGGGFGGSVVALAGASGAAAIGQPGLAGKVLIPTATPPD